MGYHLNEALNDLYQPVGFAFSRGGFTAVGNDQDGNYTGLVTHWIMSRPKSDSINFLFYHASHPNFGFHLDAIPPGSQWDQWLTDSRPILMVGAVFCGFPGIYYRNTNIRENYRWIIYFGSTNASVLLN
jgi:hypothetical protein